MVEGNLRPSSDTATHVLLYKAFDRIGGIAHTHSANATAFAQARVEIPCLGTTHADHFFGPVPVTRPLTQRGSAGRPTKANTGQVIIERFRELGSTCHAGCPCCRSRTVYLGQKRVSIPLQNAVALEAVAGMTLATNAICRQPPKLEDYVLQKHYHRKHGKDAYYGQDSG